MSLIAKPSKDAHAEQRKVTRERKLAKPHADSIHRAKKIWERLRLKSHVPIHERQELVGELFSMVTGRVHEFVFKHDSVRTIQCALRYASPDNRTAIARELKGEYKALAESRYGKFLVGKILTKGDSQTRDMVISEFTGNVRRMINHPEASWMLDDTYRGIATPSQKAVLLREWYGPEFALMSFISLDRLKIGVSDSRAGENVPTADLNTLLGAQPEKRRPVLQYLHDLINQLVQKKLTGFTMLHDAMLQYSLVVGVPGNPETPHAAAAEFIELLKSDLDSGGDLLKNLAFTSSGSRVVCRALAGAGAKDRKLILRVYREHLNTLACDANGMHVLLAAYEVVDDTVMLSRLVFPELLATKLATEKEREDAILTLATHPVGRVPLLYLLTPSETSKRNSACAPKWLVSPYSTTSFLVEEVRNLSVETSKKDPKVRHDELGHLLRTTGSGSILSTIVHRVDDFLSTSFGCQLLVEAILSSESEELEKRKAALKAIAEYVRNETDGKPHNPIKLHTRHLLKTFVQGGRFQQTREETPDNSTPKDSGSIIHPVPRLGFASLFWKHVCKSNSDVSKRERALRAWATGPGSFVIVALAEADAEEFEGGNEEKREFLEALMKLQRDIEHSASAGNRGSQLLIYSL